MELAFAGQGGGKAPDHAGLAGVSDARPRGLCQNGPQCSHGRTRPSLTIMSLDFSCFISYRHSSVKSATPYVRDFVDGFAEELDRWVDLPISFDADRLSAGDFVDESLAAKLYQSACMVVLYTPNYFSTVKTFCSREYFAMLSLEHERLPRLPADFGSHGLIIPIALRDHPGMLTQLEKAEQQWCNRSGHQPKNRLGLNFDQFTKKRQLQPGGNMHPKVVEVCRSICEKCRAFQGFIHNGGELFGSRGQLTLPAEHAIAPYLPHVVGFVKCEFPSRAA
jgi:hypothetical protein